MSRNIPATEYRDFSLGLHERAAEQSGVVKAQVELTYGCNLHCVHCYTDCYNQRDLIKERELPFDEVVRILDELHEQGVLWVCFTGGEIFMRADFFDIYRYAKQKGFLITLFTNATLITEEIADFLGEHRPFQISTSCHGATPETFEKVTQVKGSFERFKKGIRLLQERNLPIEVKTKAMTVNKHELDEIRAFIEGLGLKFRISTAIYPRLDGDVTSVEYRISPDEVLAVSEHFAGQCEHEECEGQTEVWEPASPPDASLYRCGCGTTAVHINAWGGLSACTWVEPRADLRERSVARGIAEVFPEIRAATYQTDSPCGRCEIHSLCNKMPANAAAESGDREQPVDHFCTLAHGRAARMGWIAEAGQIVGREEL